MRIAVLILIPAALVLGNPGTGRGFDGPVEARVIRVHDGDTIQAEAHVWPGQFVRTNIRIRGIDAPETKSRCASEREAAQRARRALEDIAPAGAVVVLSNISGAKYYGRVLADVLTADGVGVAPTLLKLGLVDPYDGGRRPLRCPRRLKG